MASMLPDAAIHTIVNVDAEWQFDFMAKASAPCHRPQEHYLYISISRLPLIQGAEMPVQDILR